MKELINDVIEFAIFHDPWSFDDAFAGTDNNEGRDTAAEAYGEDLTSGGKGTIDWLQSIIVDDETDADEAAELLERIEEFLRNEGKE